MSDGEPERKDWIYSYDNYIYKSSIFGSDQIRSEELLLPLDSPRRGSAVTLFLCHAARQSGFRSRFKIEWWLVVVVRRLHALPPKDGPSSKI